MVDDALTLVFKALGHPIRRELLDLLKKGPTTTGNLNKKFDEVSRYAVMKHLKILEQANLVLTRKEGRSRVNYLNAVPLRQMYDRWVNQYQSGIAGSLTELKQISEGGNEIMGEQNGLKHDTFQIEQEIVIDASREQVFEAMTKNINDWWAYRLCGQDSTLSLEPKTGGKFLEDGGNGQGALWGVVTYINTPEEIRLNGLLGMRGAVNSAYSYHLEEKGESTVLKLSHHASGLLDPEWEQMHSDGWQELLGTFLKQFVEEGKRPEQDGDQ